MVPRAADQRGQPHACSEALSRAQQGREFTNIMGSLRYFGVSCGISGYFTQFGIIVVYIDCLLTIH